MGLLEVFVKAFGHIDESFESKPDGPGFVVLPIFFFDKWTGNIQMRPGGPGRNELLKEESRSQRSSHRSADVVQVGARSFQQLLIFFGKRKFPVALALIPAGMNDSLNQFRIVSHHSGDAVAQSADDCASECRDIENMG